MEQPAYRVWVGAPEYWKDATSEQDADLLACALQHDVKARDFAASNNGADLWTECSEHPQVEIATCDGAHCHRSCDEIARADCRSGAIKRRGCVVG